MLHSVAPVDHVENKTIQFHFSRNGVTDPTVNWRQFGRYYVCNMSHSYTTTRLNCVTVAVG